MSSITNMGCLNVRILDDQFDEQDEDIDLIGTIITQINMVTFGNTGNILIVDNDGEQLMQTRL